MIGRVLIMLFTYLQGGYLIQETTIVKVNVKETLVHTGVTGLVAIEVDVKEGYHIQANKLDDESLVPTTLEVNNTESVTINKQEFPPSKQFQLEGTDSFLYVYDGKFLIKLFLTPVEKVGKHNLLAKLKYQACDAKSCLFPRVVSFSIPIEIESKN